MSERFLYTIWNRLPFRFRQRLKQNVKRNMQEQYAESEQELYRRTEQFLLKQGKIILIEVMIGGLLLAVVLAWHIFKPDYILLKRNPFGQGTKEVQISLQKGNKKKQIQYKLEEQKISLKERQKVYQAFFKQLKKEMRGRNPSLYKVSEALNLPESIAGYPFEITYELPEDGSVHLDGTLSEEVQTQLHKGERYSRYIIVTAHYREYKEKRKYKISIVPKEASSRKSAFYQVQKYLKRTEKASRHESDVKILSSYGEAKIRAGQQEAGGRGAAVLFLVTCLCIPVHNYLKLKEEGERHRKEAEKDFPVIVHLLTLYMGAGLSFLSAVRRIGFHYQEQKEADAEQYNRRGNKAMSVVKTEAEWDMKTDWNTEGEGTTILSLEKESFYPMLRDMETGIVSIIKSCPFYIGSAEGVNQLKISDKTVSREHAVILEAFYENGGEGYILRDLDSTNGTWIDGRKIKKGSQERLQEGATVRFAQKEYRFLLEHTTI